MAPPAKTAVAGKPAKSPAAKPSAAANKAKKAPAPKKVRSHPPYFEMIKEAITALKERTGSSPYAIAKFIEEKQKGLPANFKKLLSVQLKKLVASGKLTKVKNSFKLSGPVKATAAAGEKKPKKAVAVKKAPAAGAKRKRATDVGESDKKPKKKAVKVTTAAKVKKTPVKKAPAKKAVKKTPVKKPKSIKSPAKKLKK